MNLTSARIWIAGTETLAGAALLAEASRRGLEVTPLSAADTADWADAAAVQRSLAQTRPDVVFVAAGESGGIALNQAHPARLLESNLRVVLNVICAAARLHIPRLLYLASSCCHPRDAAQPLRVESLMTGPLEPTNAAYATAKLAGIAACEAIRQESGLGFFAALPATLYGPEDHFDPSSAHVATGLLLRMHEAKKQHLPSVTVWGTGTPRRDFLFSRDLADACLFLAERYDPARGPIHIGPDADLSIAEVAQAVKAVVGYDGELLFDPSRPDGAPLKRLDASPLRALGWQPQTPFPDGLRQTYAAFLHSRQ
ncbi:MAG TPA: NAD-dependent epimerase/dehydratase family protein [Kiritimatiellia bacterium]|nr:NAD-dependent epimerase/dehydratase family protein [Kiritimatiellia bacterium]